MGIERDQRPGKEKIRKWVVVEREGDHDGDEPVGQPVRGGDAEKIGADPHGSADPLVLEKVEPGQGQGVGGKHVGNHREDRDGLSEGHVRPDHQPGQQASQEHRHERNGQRCGQGMQEGPVEMLTLRRLEKTRR